MGKQRAFVRYTKKGKIVPGSLIITTKGGYPDTTSLWLEVTTDLCCITDREGDFILLEDSSPGNLNYLLQEDGDRIIL